MDKQSFLKPLTSFKRAFKEEDSRFMLTTGLKVSGISFLVTSIVYYFLFQVMRLNHTFFKALGFPDFEEESPFYDYILAEAADNLPRLFACHVFLFFIGVYLGWLILRPFRQIAEHCDNVTTDTNAVYKVEEFSTYKLLTRFSEFFFEYLREARRKGELAPNSIPPQYSKIHKPVPDKVFMLHFGLLLIIIAISSAVFISENASAIFESMVELATKTLPTSHTANKYFNSQIYILDDVVILGTVLIVILYLGLGLHLYAKVSGAAFGIFSTMRSFMKGNYSSRVHLLGYGYLRDYTRRINRYLDFVQNNLGKDRPKG